MGYVPRKSSPGWFRNPFSRKLGNDTWNRVPVSPVCSRIASRIPCAVILHRKCLNDSSTHELEQEPQTWQHSPTHGQQHVVTSRQPVTTRYCWSQNPFRILQRSVDSVPMSSHFIRLLTWAAMMQAKLLTKRTSGDAYWLPCLFSSAESELLQHVKFTLRPSFHKLLPLVAISIRK